MSNWEARVQYPGKPIAQFQQGQNVRFFKLIAQPIKHKILSNVTIEALGYNGSTPGPLIILKQGEWVFLEVENQMDEPTALHVHGLSKPNKEDGNPDIEPTPLIEPGQSYTYKFQAWQSGTFFYHSTRGFQSNLGLLGPFIVLPNENYAYQNTILDHDYIQVIQEWQIEQPELGKVFPGTYKPNKFGTQPNFFTLNGKGFPDTVPMTTKLGEKIRMRFINKTNNPHTMHLHGHDFQVVEVNGFPRENELDDTIVVGSGTRWDIEFFANNPGIWPLNGTRTFHLSNNGETPGGMLNKLIYEEVQQNPWGY